MSRIPIGRRDFLGGRFRALLGGTSRPADDVVSRGAEIDAPTHAHDRAPFAHRGRTRAGLAAVRRLARIDRFACLASGSQVCTTCFEHCPVPDAIRLEGLRPTVDASRCTGCGECELVCPAPLGAIRVLPLLEGSPS